MSLEQAILGLTAELKRYNDYRALPGPDIGPAPAAEQPKPDKPAKPAKADKPAGETPKPEPKAEPAPDYAKQKAELTTLMMDLCKPGKYGEADFGKQQARKILAQFDGAETVSGAGGTKALDQKNYGAAIPLVAAKIAELSAAKADAEV